jgi:hypothetical protein
MEAEMKRITEFLHLTVNDRLDIATIGAIIGAYLGGWYLLALLPKAIDIVHAIFTASNQRKLLEAAEAVINSHKALQTQITVMQAEAKEMNSTLNGIVGRVMGTF